MKPTKPSVRSFKNLVVRMKNPQTLDPNTTYGATIIPEGNNDVFVTLPSLQNTYTYNIINTAEMTGNITLKTSKGASLKGLILNNVGGTISIDPISQGATSFEMGSDVKDGCFVETISNGNEWFIWSVATHGSLGIGHSGGNSGNPQVSTGTVTQIPAAVEVTMTSETTFPAPSLEARHQLTIEGKGEPGTTIQVSEDNGAIQTITNIPVDSNGDWGPLTIPELLESGTYHFDFIDESSNPGTPVENELFSDNTGALIFTTPSSFTVERGTSFDFTNGASATDPSGNPIAVNTNANDYSIGLAHNATFDIVYSFTHNGTPYTRTVSGVVEDTIAPAKPTITSAGFPSNINDFVATGNAEDGSTVEIFFDNVSQGTVTSNGGTWTFTSTFVFTSTFGITVQATDAAGNISEESDETSVTYSPPTLTRPTLVIANAPTNTWTNQANAIELTGTTDAGSTIVIKDGNQTITPQSGPNYNGDDWDATINVADESNSSLTVVASKANFNSPGASLTKTLLVDRVDPVINNNQPLGDLTAYLGNLGANNDVLPATVDQTSGLNGPVISDWTTEVTATEDAKTVTYTATDLAGNSATASRTVNVTTQVIVPTNLVATGGEQQSIITGDVTGAHNENLFVKIYVIDSNGLEEVYQENGVDKEFAISNGEFSATVSLSPDNYTFEATTVNSLDEESTQSQSSNSTTVTAPAVQHLEEETDDNQEPGSQFRLLGNAAVRSDGLLEVDGSNSSYAEHFYSNNAVADYVIPNDESKTVSVWFYARTLNSGGGLIDGSIIASSNKEPNGNSPQNGGFAISVSGGRVRGKAPRVSGRGDLSHTGTTINTGEWYKVDLVWRADGTAGAGEDYNELYLNGSLVANNSEQQNISAGSNLKVGWGYWNLAGGSNGVGNPFDGFIDRLIIREEAISASDILANYNSELAIVSALDLTSPVITLSGNASESFDEGGSYNDAGATATENGAPINVVAVITNDSGGAIVNTLDSSTAAGNYTITYTATDSSGNFTSVTRAVEVVAVVNFIEDLLGVGPVFNDNSIGQNAGLDVDLSGDGIISYDSGGDPVNQEFTISFWAELVAPAIQTNVGFLGANDWSDGGLTRRLKIDLGGGSGLTSANITCYFGHLGTLLNNSANLNLANTYTHFAFVAKSDGSNLKFRIYVNGSQLSVVQTFPLETKLFPKSNNDTFTFGGRGVQDKSVKGNFDSIQIADGVALDSAQILWISQDSQRQRTIAAAIEAEDSPPSISLNGQSSLFHQFGQSFTDPGASATDQLDGSLTPTVSIVNSQNQSVSVIDSTTPVETYTITYTATDSAGQSSTVTRTVEVGSLNLSQSLLISQTVTTTGNATLSNGILDLPGGVNDYGSIPNSTDYDVTGDITYSAWVYLDDLPDQQAAIMGNLQPGNWFSGFGIQIVTGVVSSTFEGIRIACNNSRSGGTNKNDDFAVSGGISENAWHHVAMTREDSTGTARAYFNGVEIGSINNAQIGNFYTNIAIRIGVLRMGNNQPNRVIEGQIQGVRIEQTLKSESLLLQIYNAGPQ